MIRRLRIWLHVSGGREPPLCNPESNHQSSIVNPTSILHSPINESTLPISRRAPDRIEDVRGTHPRHLFCEAPAEGGRIGRKPLDTAPERAASVRSRHDCVRIETADDVKGHCAKCQLAPALQGGDQRALRREASAGRQILDGHGAPAPVAESSNTHFDGHHSPEWAARNTIPSTERRFPRRRPGEF